MFKLFDARNEVCAPHVVTLVLKSELDGEVLYDEQEAVLIDYGLVLFDVGHGELFVQECTQLDEGRWLIDLDNVNYRERLALVSDTLYDRAAKSPEIARALAKVAQAETEAAAV